MKCAESHVSFDPHYCVLCNIKSLKVANLTILIIILKNSGFLLTHLYLFTSYIDESFVCVSNINLSEFQQDL